MFKTLLLARFPRTLISVKFQFARTDDDSCCYIIKYNLCKGEMVSFNSIESYRLTF